MKLKDYLLLRKVSKRKFARKIGATEKSISLYCFGNRVPTFHFARKIHEETEGEVSYADWIATPSNTGVKNDN